MIDYYTYDFKFQTLYIPPLSAFNIRFILLTVSLTPVLYTKNVNGFATLKNVSIFALERRNQMKARLVNLCCAGTACMALWVQLPANAQTQLIKNGGFETGTFAGWKTAVEANAADINLQDNFYISNPGANTPVNAFSTASNPSGGKYYAVSDDFAPSADVLEQTFVIPKNSLNLSLSYQMFVNDQSGVGPAYGDSGENIIDYTGGNYNNPPDVQYARVDLLNASAGTFSTATTDVVDNLYKGVDNGATFPNPYTNYSFDLTSLLKNGSLIPGDSYTLRFAEANNLSPINMGIDNVSLLSSPAVPEAGSVQAVGALLLLGFASPILKRKQVNR